MAKKKIRSITIIGRRWFQRTYGNTYHSVKVYVDGDCVYSSGQVYGYDEAYIQTAWQWLRSNGYAPDAAEYEHGGCEAIWQWAERNNVTLVREVSDVAREKDL
jgi:hypothetical protein